MLCGFARTGSLASSQNLCNLCV